MKTKSGRVNPDASQVLMQNASLIVLQLIGLSWETNLKQFFPREMGLKMRSLEPEGMKNVQGTLRSLQGQAGLEISGKKNETLVKEIIMPPDDVKKR